VPALPPFAVGGVKLTTACALPAIADTAVGAPGTVAGVTEFEGDDAGPVPIALVAVTVKVYGVSFVSPVTVTGLPAPAAVTFPGFDVTVYEMMVLPPFDVGGMKLTVA